MVGFIDRGDSEKVMPVLTHSVASSCRGIDRSFSIRRQPSTEHERFNRRAANVQYPRLHAVIIAAPRGGALSTLLGVVGRVRISLRASHFVPDIDRSKPPGNRLLTEDR